MALGEVGTVDGPGRRDAARPESAAGSRGAREARAVDEAAWAGGHASRPAAGRGVAVVAEVAQTAVVAALLVVDGAAVLTGFGLSVGLVAEVLQLDVEVIGAEDIAQGVEDGPGFCRPAGVEQAAHLALAATGEADDPLAVLSQSGGGDGGGRSRSGTARWAAETRRQRLA